MVATALSTSFATIADVAKRMNPDGSIPLIAELLNQSNEILDDIVYVEGNLPTGHRITQRTSLPTITPRSLNQGVAPAKSTTTQIDEAASIFEAWSRIDVDLASLNGNTQKFRLTEDVAFIEALNEAVTGCMFYGNPTNMAGPGTSFNDIRYFPGLAARFNSISGASYNQNMLNGSGASTNNASIWLIGWGDNTVHMFYPKGSQAGLLVEDHGEQTVLDANNNPYRAWETKFQWKCGLAVKDWRYVVRICNINTANLVAQSAAADLISLISRALDRIPNFGMCKPAFYMNRTLYSMLRLQALNKSNNALSIESGLNQFGTPRKWMAFEGIPLRRVDQLLNTESTIV